MCHDFHRLRNLSIYAIFAFLFEVCYDDINTIISFILSAFFFSSATYNCFPNSLRVVPPTGFTLRGPIVSHIVIANCAEEGKSQYFIGNVSHSFQLSSWFSKN